MRALVLALLIACAHPHMTPKHWNVYAGPDLVLDVSATPGPIVSTAAPDGPPVTSAFMSATSHDAGREDDFHAWLVASHSVDEFLARARAAGLRVVAE